MGSYGLSVCFQSRYFKCLTKSHEISLSLMVQWLPELRVEVWESYLNIPETDPRHVSRHLVGFEALEVFATHDMGHSMSEYESCAVPMWRLYAIVLSEMRTRMEWASDEYCKCIARALKTWTSAGGYSLWPSLEAWQSKEIMVSNGFCFGWFWHVLAVFAFVGTVEFGVVCDGFGRLSFFVLQWWEEIWRGPGGFALCSVCFVCSRSAEASYKRWLCPFVSPDPKWEAFRGQRIARASCLKRGRVLLRWSFIQVLQQGYAFVVE